MHTVRDIMHEDVVTVRDTASIEELVRLFDEQEISGAPVVSSTGKVLGVVSRTDVFRWAVRTREDGDVAPFFDDLDLVPDPEAGSGEDLQPFFLAAESDTVRVPGGGAFGGANLADTSVDEIMTPSVHSVKPDMSVAGLARFLMDAHIHRALVVDGDQLVGIVTAFDVLRVVAESS